MLTATRNLSQLATSFFAILCQGIRRLLFALIIYTHTLSTLFIFKKIIYM